MLLKPQNERILKTFTASRAVLPCKQVLGTCSLVTNQEFLLQCTSDAAHDDSVRSSSTARSPCSSSVQWDTRLSDTTAVQSVSQEAQSVPRNENGACKRLTRKKMRIENVLYTFPNLDYENQFIFATYSSPIGYRTSCISEKGELALERITIALFLSNFSRNHHIPRSYHLWILTRKNANAAGKWVCRLFLITASVNF